MYLLYSLLIYVLACLFSLKGEKLCSEMLILGSRYRKCSPRITSSRTRSFFTKIPHPAIFFIAFPNSSFISKYLNLSRRSETFFIPLIQPPDISPPRLLAHPKPLMKLYKPRALMWDFRVLCFPESPTVFWSNPGSRKYLSRHWGSELQTEPGRGLLGLIFAGYVSLAS